MVVKYRKYVYDLPYLRRQACDDRVGDSLWYDGEADGDTGQEVGHEELFVILGKPLQDRETLQEQLAAAHRPGLASDVVYKLKGEEFNRAN